MMTIKLPYCAFFVLSLAPINKNVEVNNIYIKDKFVVKVSSTCTILGNKLAVLPYKKPKGQVPFTCTYEQDKLFNGYPAKDKIQILLELLEYEGDTAICSKHVCRYGYFDDKRPLTKSYTVQIDALYLLTTLAVGGYATYYCPYPVLFDTVTGQEINNSPKQLAEVYAIYRKWFKESSAKGFKRFNVPLRNSRYAWYGMKKGKTYMLKDEFKIGQLGSAFAVVGVCLD